LLAGTWVGCDDPFIRIYANNAGGAEMSAPAWGIFMSKVYADKKLDYGKIKTFEKPIELSTDPIYADINMDQAFMRGDSTVNDEGNPEADDYFNVPAQIDKTPVEKIDIESQIPKAKSDTGKSNKTDPKKATTMPAQKPADDKIKKPVKQKTENDY